MGSKNEEKSALETLRELVTSVTPPMAGDDSPVAPERETEAQRLRRHMIKGLKEETDMTPEEIEEELKSFGL